MGELEPNLRERVLRSEPDFLIGCATPHPVPLRLGANMANIDWQRLLYSLRRNKVWTLAAHHIERLELGDQLPADFLHPLAQAYAAAEILGRLHWRDLLEVRSAFDHAGIPVALIKGGAFRWRLYPTAACRPGMDVDLLIRPDDIARAKEVMCELGYAQAALTPSGDFVPVDEAALRKVEERHYELGQFVRHYRLPNLATEQKRLLAGFDGLHFHADEAGHFHTYSVFDIHWNLHFHFDPGEVFEGLCQRLIGGEPFALLGREWEILYSVFKLYFESSDRYRQGLMHLADLIGLFSEDAEIDSGALIELVERHRMEPAAFYVLSHLKGTCRTRLPASLLRHLPSWKSVGRQRYPNKLNDRGDFLPFVLGTRLPARL